MTNPQQRLRELLKQQPFYLAAAVCFGLGVFLHWFLVVSFLLILPPLHDDIERMRLTLLQPEPSPESDEPAEVKTIPPAPKASPKAARRRAPSTTREEPPECESPESEVEEGSTPVANVPRKKMAPWGSPTLRIRDMQGNILEVNSDKPVPYESEYFVGTILTMVRCEGGRWQKHFEGKQRKFEVQIQGKMKKLPEGNVMLGGELEEKIEFGLITRTVISILMKFAAKLLPSMRYSLGEAYSADGKYECPQVASPLFRTMDRVWITPEGETPPELGKELPEPDAERNLRRGGKAPYTDMRFEMGKIYSFSFHSMYLDFGNWVITNVPGYNGLDLKTLVETQPVSIVCYDIPFDPPGKVSKQHQCNKKYLTFFEYSHISMMPEAELNEYNAYMANPISDEEEPETEIFSAVAESPASPEECTSIDASPIPERSGTSSPTGKDDDSSGNENEDDVLADVPSNSFLPISLPQEDAQNSVWPGVGGKNGFAVVRDFQDVQSLKFVKLNSSSASPAMSKPRSSLRMWPMKSKNKSKAEKNIVIPENTDAKDGDSFAFWKSEQKSGEKLRNGDVILVQSALTGEYLTIQRGWWLVWSSRSPQSRKGHFIVTLVDHEEKVRSDTSPLYVGFPFRLRSAKWPTWQVGLQHSPSATYGGKLLTLYHPPKSSGDRHASIDLSMSSFAKSMTADSYSLPIYSSKAVKPLVMSVLPESVCEKYSRETVGLIRSIMSMNAVFRDANLSSKEVLFVSSAKIDKLDPSPNNQCSSYVHSSRISLPVAIGKNAVGYSNSGKEVVNGLAGSAALSKALNATNRQFDSLSFRYFPRSLLDVVNLGGVHFELSGWAEVMNRETGTMQLAFMLSCEIPDTEHSVEYDVLEIEDAQDNPRVIYSPSMLNLTSSSGYGRVRRFTVLRSGAQIIEILSMIHALQESPKLSENETDDISMILKPSLEQAISNKSTDISSVIGEPDLDRIFSDPVGNSSNDIRSDSSEEPEEVNNMQVAEGISTDTKKDGESMNSSVHMGSPIDDICPRHQGDADHSFQLLKVMLRLFQKRESLLAAKIDEVGISKSMLKNPCDYPARRALLKLAASKDDVLTNSFLSDVTKAPSKSEHKPSDRKRASSLRKSVSGADLANESQASPLLRTTVVARALWDTHWREEFVQLHASFISFLPLISMNDPVSKAAGRSGSGRKRRSSKAKDFQGTAPSGPPSLTLLMGDITSVSLMDESFSKFPGYHILKLESVGRVTYLAFNTLAQCESFAGYVLELKSEAALDEESSNDLPSIEGVMSDPRDSFVLRSGRWRPQSRMILNSRRFQFDIEQQRAESFISNAMLCKPWLIHYPSLEDCDDGNMPPDKVSGSSSISYWDLSEKLLRDVSFLCTTGKSGNSNDGDKADSDRFKMTGKLLSFLDNVGALKLIELVRIDFSSREAVCFFMNIYHTLLLHARLVLGIPTEENWTSFFDTVSYEIGGDVFSLIELEHCVLRGKLSRPEVLPKVGYKLPLHDDDRYSYGLSMVDPRINFAISNGSLSSPNVIYAMTPVNFEEQLTLASRKTLEFCLDINTSTRSITLPRACFLYRSDFLSTLHSTESSEKDDDSVVLGACLKYLGPTQSENIENLLSASRKDKKSVHVCFREADYHSHLSLTVPSPE